MREKNCLLHHLIRDEHKRALVLFWLCWLVYFSANLGRLSYTSSVAIVLEKEGFNSATGGMISMGFFLCYGVGQLFSGYAGDRVQPKSMVLLGLLFTAVCNILFTIATTSSQMMIIWSVNGVAQSMLWPPILRILSEHLPAAYQKKAYTYIATTYPVATLACYIFSSAIASSQHWQVIFWFASVMLLCSAVCWVFIMRKLTGYSIEATEQMTDQAAQQKAPPQPKGAYPIAALLLFCLVLMVQGALRDGVMIWVPTLLSDVFQVSVAKATLLTSIMPFANMLGLYSANLLYRRMRSEAGVSVALFGVACVFTLVLTGSRSLLLSVCAFALIAACMMGINLMLVSFVPTYFVSRKKVALFSGITNAMVYVGSSIASYGFGWAVDVSGWTSLFTLLIGLALVGAILSGLASPFWRRFLKREQV